jgi:hypothetical protein
VTTTASDIAELDELGWDDAVLVWNGMVARVTDDPTEDLPDLATDDGLEETRDDVNR